MLLYLLGVNLLLNTELASRWINRKPEKSLVHWDRAWTLIPGRIAVQGLRFRGQQKGARWYLELASAEMSLRLQPLASRRFETHWIRGEDLMFRHRLIPEPGQEHKRSEALPPIPEPDHFPRQSVDAPSTNRPESAPRSTKPPWMVELRGIHIRNVREIWVDAYRFAGDGDLRAECSFEIRGPFQMKQGSLELQGDLSSGDESVAQEVDFAMEAQLHPFIFGQNKGRAALRFLNATAQISSPHASLGVLDQYFRGTEWLAINGTGRLKAEVVLDRGNLRPGTWFEANEGQFDLNYLDFQTHGTGSANGKVENNGAESPVAILEARLDSFDLRRHGAKTPHIKGSGFAVRAVSPNPDLVVPKPDFEATIDLPPSDIIDLTSYNAYIPQSSGFRFDSGQATLQAHFDLSSVPSSGSGSGSGQLVLEGQRIAASIGTIDIVADLKLNSQLADADPETRRFNLSGSRLELTQVLIKKQGNSNAKFWWAHFDLPEGKVRLGHPLELNAKLVARLRDSGPIIALVEQKKPLLKWMRPILEVSDLNLRGEMELVKDTVTIEDLVLTGDRLEILADFEIAGRKPSGAVFIRRGPLSAALALDDYESKWKVFRAKKWYRARTQSSEKF